MSVKTPKQRFHKVGQAAMPITNKMHSPSIASQPKPVNINSPFKLNTNKRIPAGIGPIGPIKQAINSKTSEPLKPPAVAFKSPGTSRIDLPDITPVEGEWSLPANYKIYFAILDPSKIINLNGPDYMINIDNWADAKQIERKIKMGEKYIQEMDKHLGFYRKLEQSILQYGFLNPILVTKGPPQFKSINTIAPKYRAHVNDYFICEFIGGSRLHIARKLKLLVPCIISDFTQTFTQGRLIQSKAELLTMFNDPPVSVKLAAQGLKISPPTHIHLEKHLQDPLLITRIRRDILH